MQITFAKWQKGLTTPFNSIEQICISFTTIDRTKWIFSDLWLRLPRSYRTFNTMWFYTLFYTFSKCSRFINFLNKRFHSECHLVYSFFNSFIHSVCIEFSLQRLKQTQTERNVSGRGNEKWKLGNEGAKE